MQLDEHPYLPYPRDPVTRFGFIIGDLITLAVLLLLFVPVVNIFFLR